MGFNRMLEKVSHVTYNTARKSLQGSFLTLILQINLQSMTKY